MYLGSKISAWWRGGDKDKKQAEEEEKEAKGAPVVELTRDEPVEETLAKHKEKIDAVKKAAGVPADSTSVDDVVVYRFLKGWNFDVEQTTAAVTKMVKWRQENKVDEIRAKVVDMKQDQYPHAAKMAKQYPCNVHVGLDKKGQPVALFRTGIIDPAAFAREISVEDLVEYHTYFMEYRAHLAAKYTKETGKVVRLCVIMDLTGLSLRHLNRSFLKYLRAAGDISQDYYAEVVGNIIMINPPWAFQMLWRVIKPMIKPYTLEKISVLNNDAEWQKELQKGVDSQYIPKEWGGTLEGAFPEIDINSGLTKIDIAARAKHEVKVHAEDKDILISWEFHTAAKNIGFGVKFVPDGGGEERWMRELETVESHVEVQSGGVRCSEAGTVVLVWDNSASMLTGKTLFFRTDKVQEKIVERERRATLVFKYAPGADGDAAAAGADAAAPAEAAPAAEAPAAGAS